MNKRIRHSGIVEAIDGECVRVRIEQSSACGSCKVASACNASERATKTIDVYGAAAGKSYAVGDEVVVSVSERSGFEALAVAFVAPFVLLLAVVVVLSLLTGNETVAALGGIATLIPYYGAVYLLRDKIGSRFAFEIEG